MKKTEINQKDKNKKEKIESEVSINKSRLNKLIEIDDLQEIYYLLNILNDKQTEKLIDHYKKEKLIDGSKISKIFHNSNNKKEFITLLEQEIISNLKERLEIISSKISEERKKGNDVYFEWIKAMSAQLKIKLYQATLDKRDLYKIKKILEELETSLRIFKNKNQNSLN